MRCPKSVTPRKLEANRKNAKRSTGPRTQRGKRDTRFNAVTLGLFAKHVVIPICDGYKPEKDFSSLLDGMHEEFQPVGLYEEWLVVKIAEYMWRLRRASRCESGSVRESAIWARRDESMMVWAGGRDDNQRTLHLASELGVLDEAQKQLKDSGALSQSIYEKVATIVENERQKAIRAENDEKSVETEFDRELFLTCIAGLGLDTNTTGTGGFTIGVQGVSRNPVGIGVLGLDGANLSTTFSVVDSPRLGFGVMVAPPPTCSGPRLMA